jgi:hypothetical protein
LKNPEAPRHFSSYYNNVIDADLARRLNRLAVDCHLPAAACFGGEGTRLE